MVTKKTKSDEATEIQVSGGSSIVGKIGEFKEFLELSKVEIKKVVWPTRKETVTTAVAVLVLVVVMAVFLGVVDAALAKLMQLVLRLS